MVGKRRRHIPIRWIRKLLKRQDDECAVKECFELLILPKKGKRNFVIEHRHALALGGKDIFKNLELRCIAHAREKTIGTGATTAGSDIGNIKKLRHLRKKQLHKIDKPPLHRRKPKTRKYRWMSRPLRSGKTRWPKRRMGHSHASRN